MAFCVFCILAIRIGTIEMDLIRDTMAICNYYKQATVSSMADSEK